MKDLHLAASVTHARQERRAPRPWPGQRLPLRPGLIQEQQPDPDRPVGDKPAVLLGLGVPLLGGGRESRVALLDGSGPGWTPPGEEIVLGGRCRR